MGQVTPNMSIYIPAAGETNYDSSFALGMINIDQHDHSGPPDNGVKLTSTSIADGSITFAKLAAGAQGVVDTTTGLIQQTAPFANRIALASVLSNIFNLNVPTPTAGFLSINGVSSAFAATLIGTSHQIAITNPTGAANPVFSLTPIVSLTTQPAFSYSANSQSSVTGNGAAYQVLFANMTFDQGSNVSSSVFTVPANGDGIYEIGTDLQLIGMTSAMTDALLEIYVNGSSAAILFHLNPANIFLTGPASWSFSGSRILKLSATNTVTIVLTISNGVGNTASVSSGDFYGVKIW